MEIGTLMLSYGVNGDGGDRSRLSTVSFPVVIRVERGERERERGREGGKE